MRCLSLCSVDNSFAATTITSNRAVYDIPVAIIGRSKAVIVCLKEVVSFSKEVDLINVARGHIMHECNKHHNSIDPNREQGLADIVIWRKNDNDEDP